MPSVAVAVVGLCCILQSSGAPWTVLADFEGGPNGWGAEAGPIATVRQSGARAASGRRSLAVTLVNERPDMVRATWSVDVSDLRFAASTRFRFHIFGSRLAGAPHGGLIVRESGGAKGGGDSQWIAPIAGDVYTRERWQTIETAPLSEWTQPGWSVDADGRLDATQIGRIVFVAQLEVPSGSAKPFTFYMDRLEATNVARQQGRRAQAEVETQPRQVRPPLRGFVWRSRAHPAQVRFHNLRGWSASAYGAMDVRLVQSREEPLFGDPTARLDYSSRSGLGRIELIPPRPIPLPQGWNACQIWLFGNNWDWVPDASTPQVDVFVLVRDRTGETFRMQCGRVNWKFWGLLHRLTPRDPARDLGRASSGGNADGVIDEPSAFVGLELRNCGNREKRELYFDSVAFYREEAPRVTLRSQPKLPFPTPGSIVPPTIEATQVRVTRAGARYVFTSVSSGGTVRYVYTPRTGTLDDLTAECGDATFKPAAGGGPMWNAGGAMLEPGSPAVARTLLRAETRGSTLITRWRWAAGRRSVEYTLTLQIVGRSLTHTWDCPTREMAGLRLGRATGLRSGRYIAIPFFTFMGLRGAGALCDRGVFATHVPDWYVTNSSAFDGRSPQEDASAVSYTGSILYRPCTDGKLNPLHERCVLSVSPRFEEVLPRIANPPSPLTPILRNFMYTHLGGTTPDRFDGWLAQLRTYKAYGIDRLIVTQHEDSWTEGADVGQGPQEYTMTTSGPPDAGGDAAMKRYYAQVRALGHYVGPYNNYCDFSPLGLSFNEDYVTRTSEGEWQRSWPPTFNIRPAKAAEMAAKYGPMQARKYGVTATYCDVHTCVPPWLFVDYQAGTSGAGMFRTTFNAYGRVLTQQRVSYGGPAFSEGSHHCFYAGLIDGSYGQMGLPDPPKQPLLLDFDLLRLHPQGADISMLPGPYWDGGTYHCMATTIAYGHAGFFPFGDVPDSLRYYHLIGALQRRYIQERVTDIAYWDGVRFEGASEALQTGANLRGQVRVRYRNGLTVWVNRSADQTWEAPGPDGPMLLTPSAWLATAPDGFATWCTQEAGRRVSYVGDADLVFCDAGGTMRDFGPIQTSGMVVLRKTPDGALELIVAEGSDPIRVRQDRLGGATRCRAVGANGSELGDAAMRPVAGASIEISPIAGAVRYRFGR